MMPSGRGLLVTLLLGLVAAGPPAALALAAVPANWRGPVVPAAVLVMVVLAVAWLRHGPGPGRRVRRR